MADPITNIPPPPPGFTMIPPPPEGFTLVQPRTPSPDSNVIKRSLGKKLWEAFNWPIPKEVQGEPPWSKEGATETWKAIRPVAAPVVQGAGMMGGAALGGLAGGIPGGIVGAGVGGALGTEAVREADIRSGLAAPEPVGQRVKEGLKEVPKNAALQAVGMGAVPVLQVAADVGASIPIVSKGAEKILEYTPEWIKTATKYGVQTAKAAKDWVEREYTKTAPAEYWERQANKVIDFNTNKGVKPTIQPRGAISQINEYTTKTRSAVKDIITNKSNLELTDASGNLIKGKLPLTVKGYSEAIYQTKNNLWQHIRQRIEAATGRGVTVDPEPLAKIAEKYAGNRMIAVNHPDAGKAAMEWGARLRKGGPLTPEEAQELLTDFNKKLSGYWKNKAEGWSANEKFSIEVSNALRQELDKVVDESTLPGLQDLKNRYGALKHIESDIAKREGVAARANLKGLVDMSDIWTTPAALYALMHLEPDAAVVPLAAKAVKGYIKYVNSPNRLVRGMFNEAEGYMERAAKMGAYEEASKGGVIPIRAKALSAAPTTLQKVSPYPIAGPEAFPPQGPPALPPAPTSQPFGTNLGVLSSDLAREKMRTNALLRRGVGYQQPTPVPPFYENTNALPIAQGTGIAEYMQRAGTVPKQPGAQVIVRGEPPTPFTTGGGRPAAPARQLSPQAAREIMRAQILAKPAKTWTPAERVFMNKMEKMRKPQ